ncbi:ABC transporter substrate-binding protein [Natronoarchaeum sp. GCM10025703]|uniref:ABC transporter substrate-binding protein n=1 Tax=unclassified Natronoarchaeum TaxID=2620183 RepID=UPI0036220C48
MKLLGASSVTGLAGCLDTVTNRAGGNGDEDTGSGYPPADEGAEVWGKILNDHADGGDRYDPDADGEVLYDPGNVPYDNAGADIDWQQFADDDITLTFGMGLHPYSTVTQPVIPAFEELTGIDVEYEIFPEDRYWLEARDDLQNRREYDGMMTGLWQAAEFHANGWVRDLTEFIENDDLTDRDWLAMDDFLDDTIELMSFPDADGRPELTGFPNGIEAYGAVGCDVPTFEAVDDVADDPADEIATFSDLERAAKRIHESEQTSQYDDEPRAGITSRTSTTTLSSANWATMFKTHGGNWIDREQKEATLADPDSGGVESLELFGRLMRDYGPENPGQKNWYRANNALSAGETAMVYTTPSTSGAITEEQIERTHWIPPLPAPDGGDPEVATWVWATGISQYSENPEAAWLFIQWANSRLGNYMLSARQWQGHGPRAGTARLNYLNDTVGLDETHPGITQSFLDAHIEGMSKVPTDPPAIPVDTPQNMPIMTEAAVAMNNVVRGVKEPTAALEEAAPTITEYAKQIPDLYLD